MHAGAALTAGAPKSAEAALDEHDLRRLARLHVDCIDDSVPALLGVSFAARYYAFLEQSDSEHLLCERVEGRVESAVVVSESPGDLQGRSARATLPHLAVAALRALVRRREFRRFLRGALGDAFGSSERHKAPEITYVFTNPQLQGKGFGKRLIERVDALLRSRGVAIYYVKTLDDPANRSIAFYEREGFERIGTRDEAGRRFVEFHKRLDQR